MILVVPLNFPTTTGGFIAAYRAHPFFVYYGLKPHMLNISVIGGLLHRDMILYAISIVWIC